MYDYKYMGLVKNIVAFAKHPHTKLAFEAGKKIYKIPYVQKKWGDFKKRNKLEYLPFGKMKPGKLFKNRYSGKIRKFRYKRGVVNL